MLQQKKDGKTKPRLAAVLQMKCPYCAQTPLRAEKAWFTFRRGCQSCDYRFEREIGYYTGASWMVTFPLVSLIAFAAAGLLMVLQPTLDAMVVVAVVAVLTLGMGVLLTPFCMALWLYFEHWFHPLNAEDSFDKELH